MDVPTSTEFRKVYASLRNPTQVTVNGHIIGEWTPRYAIHTDWTDNPPVREPMGITVGHIPPRVGLTQAQRDAILRKVNRSGRE